MKILITGPRGFVASHLIQSLRAQTEIQVTSLDRDLKPELYPQFFEQHRFDAVIHLATLFLKTHEYSQIQPLVESNLLLTTRLLDCAHRSSVKKFITFGTYYEFPVPATLYAATKAAVNPILSYYANQAELQIQELIIYDTYGPKDPRVKILNSLIQSARSGKELHLSPGKQILKLTHVSDVCSAILHALSATAATKKSLPFHNRTQRGAHPRGNCSKGRISNRLQTQCKMGGSRLLAGCADEPHGSSPPTSRLESSNFSRSGTR